MTRRAPRRGFGLAYVDVTHGRVRAAEVSETPTSPSELARLGPAEALLPEGADLPGLPAASVTPLDQRLFQRRRRRARLRRALPRRVARGLRPAQPRRSPRRRGRGAGVPERQPARRPEQRRDLAVYNPSRFMLLDPRGPPASRDLASSREGGKRGSLLDAIDSTRRRWARACCGRWLGQPLADMAAINARLDNVERFFGDAICRSQTRDALRGLPDVERISAASRRSLRRRRRDAAST